MPLSNYVVGCTRRGCSQAARYKVAARWGDGLSSELKTYALACEQCLPALFRAARQRQAVCRRAVGETLDPPGIYLMQPGQRDVQLQRLIEREMQLLADAAE